MGTILPTAEMHRFCAELIALMGKHSENLPSEICMALAAHALGQIVALQDQRTMTSERAMQIIRVNMQLGNDAVVAELAAVVGPVQ